MRPVYQMESLTGLRGLAALYVVSFHYLYPARPYSNPFTTFIANGSFAVDLFFVLSGFVMALNYSHMFAGGSSKAKYLKFIGRRLARLYPLYFVTTLVGFVLALVGWLDYTREHPLGLDLFLNLAVVQVWGLAQSIDGPGWSLSAEWAAMLVFPLLLIPSMFGKPYVAWICAIVCAGTLAAVCALPASLVNGGLGHDPRFGLIGIHDYWHALPLLRCIPEFMLGILAFRLAGTSFGRRVGSSQFISPAICLLMLVLTTIPGTDLAFVILLPLLIISLTSETHLAGRILTSPPVAFVGRLSYSIVLTHWYLGQLQHGFVAWARSRGLPHIPLFVATVEILLTLAIASLTYRTIEEPGRRWLRTVFEGQAPDPLKRPNPSASPASVGTGA